MSVSLNSSPHVDFLKKSFQFDSGGQAKLKDDLVVFLWKSNNGKLGLLQAFVDLEEPASSAADTVDTSTSTTTSAMFGSHMTPRRPCDIRIKFGKNGKNLAHDFDAVPLLIVPFQIEVENKTVGNVKECMFRYKVDQEEGPGRFLGCTRAAVKMSAGGRISLPFHIGVTVSGLFKFTGFSFNMTDVGDELDDDEYVPLEISFVVNGA